MTEGRLRQFESALRPLRNTIVHGGEAFPTQAGRSLAEEEQRLLAGALRIDGTRILEWLAMTGRILAMFNEIVEDTKLTALRNYLLSISSESRKATL
jgi:hypothetical protein